MTVFTQASARLLHVTTPLGKDALLLRSFSGQEELSRPFSYQLDLLSHDQALAARDIVGKPVTWVVRKAGQKPRYFNAVVRAFSAGPPGARGLRSYRAEVVPWLWLLTRTADCRVFQNKNVPEILDAVFTEYGFRDYKSSLRRSYAKWDYCVQYRETAFAFVSRLMEHEGLFYYFHHEDGKHTLVMADHKGGYLDCAEGRVSYAAGTQTDGHVRAWERRCELRPGRWAVTDYNFETPSTSLLASTPTLVKLPGVERFEVFDYPGEHQVRDEGKADVKVRMEEEEAGHDVVSGASDCCSFTPGGKFTLRQHACQTENRGWALASVSHQAHDASYEQNGDESQYGNSFTCLPDDVVFRPTRTTPKPAVRGPQTAVVVGPRGQEIYTDKYGRVKVQFHWDRLGKKDENSSCWVRVAQPSAGKQWGSAFWPRIGQEVVVSFLEGDPDSPLILGCVYNAEQMPPFGMPESQNVTGMKTCTTPGGGGYNEISFDDTKGKEKFAQHAQFDMNTKVLNDQTQSIDGFRDALVKKDQREKVNANHHLTVDADRNEKVAGTVSLDAGGMQTKVKGIYALEAGQEVHVQGGPKVVIEAADVTIKSGGNFLRIDPSGVTIVGTLVRINSGGAPGEGSGCSPTAPDAPKGV